RSALTTLRDRSVPKCSDAEPGRDGRALTQYPRALARHQVGMPLARWRVGARGRAGGCGGAGRGERGGRAWGRAAEPLRAGQSLADAAITARLADQAHLPRWMREMVGLTPAAALPGRGEHS